MIRNGLIFFVAIIIALFLFGWAEYQVAPSFQSCISQNSTKQSTESFSDYGKIVAIYIKSRSLCSLCLIDRHNGFFAAIAAAIIAAFTFTLWRSTDKLWTAGQEIFEAGERAFVFLEGFDIELTTAANAKVIKIDELPERYRSDPDLYISRFAVLPRWKNSGNTPTRKMTIQVNWRGPKGPIPPDYIYGNPPEPFFLAPKTVEPSALVEMPGAAVLIDWALRPAGVEPIVFIWGRADFEDVFGKKHFIEWCRRLRFDRHDGKKLRASFIQWGDYNRSD